jgi:hypothetical protein
MAWEADAAAGSEFLQYVVAWTEGTAAQLLRDQWRVGVKRPSATDIQARLRHHLATVAEAGAENYLEALDRARALVIDEISPNRTRSTARRIPRPL